MLDDAVVKDLVPNATAKPPRDRCEKSDCQDNVPKPRGPRRAELVESIVSRHYVR